MGILATIMGSSLFYGQHSSDGATFGSEEKKRDRRSLSAQPDILWTRKYEAHSDFLLVTDWTSRTSAGTRSPNSQFGLFTLGPASSVCPSDLISGVPWRLVLHNKGWGRASGSVLCWACFISTHFLLGTASHTHRYFDYRDSSNLWVDKWRNWSSKRRHDLLKFPQLAKKKQLNIYQALMIG